MLDEKASKTVHKDEERDQFRKKENININPQSLQEIYFLEREVLSLHLKIFVEAFIRIDES